MSREVASSSSLSASDIWSKNDVGGNTETSIKSLEGDLIYEHLARMFAGDNISQTAIKQACDMRNKAKFKK